MELTIEKISDNEHFEYKGDVHITGNIGKGATVIVKDGNLIVDGDVAEKTDIKISQTSNASVVVSSGTFFMNNMVIGGINSGSSLTIKGNVGNNVTVASTASDLNVDGDIGNNCKFNTQSGDINAANVGSNTTLKTMSGDIVVTNVGNNSTLKSMSGDIRAANVERGSSLETMSGDVKVQMAHSSVNLQTMSGSIYENGVKRRKDRSNNQSSFVSIGNMSVIGGGRIIVNGRDITDIVEREANQESSAELPVRFMKK